MRVRFPGAGGSPGVGNGNPLQDPCLENSRDRGTWWAIVYGFAKSWIRLSMHVTTHTHTHTLYPDVYSLFIAHETDNLWDIPL